MKPEKVTLYAYDKAPMLHPVRIALHEYGVEYETIFINPYVKADWFKALTPNGQGQVPLLKVDDDVLFESSVILEYLDEVYGAPRLLPEAPAERARNRAWTMQALDYLMAQAGMVSVRRVEEYEGCRAGLLGKMALLEAQLGQGPFFNGEQVAPIDFQYAAILLRQDILDRQYGTDIIPGFPKVAAWTRALIARPSVSGTLPQVEPGQSFDDVYLASFLDTYVSSQRAAGLVLRHS